MIRFENINKVFTQKKNNVNALQDINLEIETGDIFGIIGFSGAGKSTLLRTINALEKPTSGKVIVDGDEIYSLNAKELRAKRKNIGMIFYEALLWINL